MKDTMVNFKTSQPIAKLIELETTKRGYKTKSEFLTMAVMDFLFGFEAVRHKDRLVDFLDIALPSIASQGKFKDVAGDLISELQAIQRVYIKERLTPHLRLQRHLTDHAIEAYIAEDNIIEPTGYEGFVAMNCLVGIYDKLYACGIITKEQWEAHVEHYDFYMNQGEGAKLLQLIQQE